MEILKYVLKLIGKNTADVICSNPNICFTERATPDGKCIIDLLNVCTNSDAKEKFEFTFKDGGKITGEALPCEIQKTVR